MNKLLIAQREFFNLGSTKTYNVRKEYLYTLKKGIIKYEEELYTAIYKDLNKSKAEAYMCEIGLVLSDITYQIKHLKRNMKIKKKKTPLSQFKGKSYIIPEPYGNTLIISPWNYPILLSLQPLVGAIAAGNTAILKLSEYSNNTNEVIVKIINSVFPKEYVTVVLGDYRAAEELLNLDFDYIFFTGGINVGEMVAATAGKKLIPVTLELGGKSPTIVDETAKIDLACKRIVFGKFLNAGQTCVAPDYIIAKEEIRDELISCLIKYINQLYPDSLNNQDYVKIINEKHFNRLLNYIKTSKVIYGGKVDTIGLKIEPTIVASSLDSSIMQEEIFGPILPILTYRSNEELLAIIKRNPNPLALYLFSNNKRNIDYITKNISFGGGCINDTIIHLANHHLPFGGVGQSGMGSYHGDKSFEIFSHYKAILNKSNFIDLPMRYTPYTKGKNKIIKFFLK